MTPRQAQLLAFLRERALDGGPMPTLLEMARHLGGRSTGPVCNLLNALERMALITRLMGPKVGRYRGIVVIGVDEYERGFRAGLAAAQKQAAPAPSIIVPAWVPPALRDEYLSIAARSGEEAAASRVRSIKARAMVLA